MGKKAKGSRKGKKALRANISTEEIEDFLEQSTKDALSGGSLSQLPNDSLFYADSSKDLSVKRKIDKHREKVLRCDSVLQENPFVQAVPSSKSKQKKKSKKNSKDVVKEKDETWDGQKGDDASAPGLVDIWAMNVKETNRKGPKTFSYSSCRMLIQSRIRKSSRVIGSSCDRRDTESLSKWVGS